jgi:hypothetical protein
MGLICLIASCAPIPKVADSGKGDDEQGSTSSVLLLPQKPKVNGVNIEWLSPSPAELSINEIGGKVEIRIRITSSTVISPEQIEIYINGVSLGNKADEVSLLKRPEFKDQIMVMHVPVTLGNNSIQVVVTKDADQRFLAERILIKDDKGVRIKPAPVTGNTRITWIEPDAISLAGQMYTTKSRELGIRLNITSPDNLKKENILVLHNRKYLYPSASATLLGQAGSFVFKDFVTMDENADINEIALKVTTSSGNVESENLKVNYSPIRPNVYLLSIGTQLNLKYAYKDARDIARLYANQSHQTYKLFNSVQIDTLIGPAAITTEIRGMIETIKNKFHTGQIAEDDIVMLFISSHGFMDDKGDFRIQGNDYVPERRSTTSVSYKHDILDQLDELPCKKLVLIDACHSGGARANATDILDAIHDIKNAPRGFAILTSSSKDEESYEDIKWQNGAFTEAILKGLKEGKADLNKNGIITLMELDQFIGAEVPSMVTLVKNKEQHPLLSRNDIGDLPIFIIQ